MLLYGPYAVFEFEYLSDVPRSSQRWRVETTVRYPGANRAHGGTRFHGSHRARQR
jgi:hypothetical protein